MVYYTDVILNMTFIANKSLNWKFILIDFLFSNNLKKQKKTLVSLP